MMPLTTLEQNDASGYTTTVIMIMITLVRITMTPMTTLE